MTYQSIAPHAKAIDLLMGMGTPKLFWFTIPNRSRQAELFKEFCDRYAADTHHEVVHLVDVRGHSTYRYLSKLIRRLDLPPETRLIIHLVDWEWISQPTEDEPSYTPELLANINFERELYFQELPASLVCWSYPSSTLNVQRYAQDFWDWLVYKFEFGEKKSTSPPSNTLREAPFLPYHPTIQSDLPRYLTLPPKAPDFLVDRGDIGSQLYARLKKEQVLVLNGMGGLGKTTLSLAYIEAYAEQYEHIVWLEVGQNLALSVASSPLGASLGLIFEERSSLQDRFSRTWAAMDQLKGPSLLVLDGIQRFKDLDADLLKFENWKVLITTRLRPRHLASFSLRSLTREASWVFLQYLWPEGKAYPEASQALLAALQDQPLLLEVVGQALSQSSHPQALLSYIIETSSTHHFSEGLLPEVLDELLGKQELAEVDKEILFPLALLPDKFYPYNRWEQLLPQAQIRDKCADLVERGWLEYDRKLKAFKMHALIQSWIRSGNRELLPFVEDWLNAFTQQLKAPLLAQRIEWLEEATEMARAIRKPNSNLASLHRALYDTYMSLGNISEAKIAVNDALAMYEALNDRVGQAHMFSYLGNIQVALGQLVLAQQSYEKDLVLTEGELQSNPQSEQLQRDLSVSYNKLGDLAQARGESQEAKERYEASLAIRKSLAESNPQSEQLQRDLSVSLEKLGNLAQARGESQEAKERYEASLAIAQSLAESNPQSEQLQRDLSVSLEKLGNLAQARGESQEAKERYEASLAIAQSLAESNPQSEQLQRDLSVSYNKLGDLAQARGESQEAKERYEASLAIAQSLAESNPQSEQLQRDLSVSYNKLGDLAQARGESQEAKERYEASLAIAQSLAESNPQSEQLQRDLSVSLEKLGNLAQARGESQEAKERYEASLAIAQSLAESNPQSEQLQRDLSVSYNKLGDLAQARGESQEAKERYEASLAIRKSLAESNPQSEQLQRDLSVSLEKLGNLAQARGESQEAKERYEASLAIAQSLAESNPQRIQLRDDLAISYYKLARLYESEGKMDQAHSLFQQAAGIWEMLATATSLPRYRKFLDIARKHILALEEKGK